MYPASAAVCLSVVNLAVFLGWALPHIPSFVTLMDWMRSRVPAMAPGMRRCATILTILDKWRWGLGIVSTVTFGFWLWFKERALRAVFAEANYKWPSPGEVNKRGRQPMPPWSPFQFRILKRSDVDTMDQVHNRIALVDILRLTVIPSRQQRTSHFPVGRTVPKAKTEWWTCLGSA
jgi:hypothetical protein